MHGGRGVGWGGRCRKNVTESLPGGVDEAENDKSSRKGSDGLSGSSAAGSGGGSLDRGGVLPGNRSRGTERGDQGVLEAGSGRVNQTGVKGEGNESKCKLDTFVEVQCPQILTCHR